MTSDQELKMTDTEMERSLEHENQELVAEWRLSGFRRFTPKMLNARPRTRVWADLTYDEAKRREHIASRREYTRRFEDPLTIPLWDRCYAWVEVGDVALTRAIKPFVIKEEGRLTRYGFQPTRRLVLRRQLQAARAKLAETADARRRARNQKQDREYGRAEAEIKRQFPLIPEDDLWQVVRRAFTVGNGTVGRTSALDLDDKCRLAVIAHVRHQHTDYDDLMRRGEGDRGYCRDEIRGVIAEVLDLWSGECIGVGEENLLAHGLKKKEKSEEAAERCARRVKALAA